MQRLKRAGCCYGVSSEEVQAFVSQNCVVAHWLGKYRNSPATYLKYSRGLCMFFKWLRNVKNMMIEPAEFLKMLASKRVSGNLEERSWGKFLVLEFSRDNPDLLGRSDSTILSSYIMPVKQFCAENEVELTIRGSLVGPVRRKYAEPAFTVELARKVLGILNQRDRAICMTMLQSGQSVSQVLVDVNQQADIIIRQVAMGKERIRLDFGQRKGNGFCYHSFISRDAINEIRKWLIIREQWLEKLKTRSRFLFITKDGKPMEPQRFLSQFTRSVQSHGLWTGPLSTRTQMFRKIFETEASPPERGISKAYVKYMMGHSSGTGSLTKLDIPGGTYDNAPRIYLDAVEMEYRKLEPYINIYTGMAAQQAVLTEPEMDQLRELLMQIRDRRRENLGIF